MDLEKTLNDALSIIEGDLSKINQISKDSEPLDRIQAQKLTDYVKVLIIAAKNEREAAKVEGLNEISDEELEEMAKLALQELQPKKQKKGKKDGNKKSNKDKTL